ncbi:HAMP domain-containing histidine kinase [Christensenellaceae bacterium OttesenSCG-928-M15]|nr:HAMP domain-containing histidine kinase [Christensenellaceae bacterium OttesenSCG-928-M15]
MTIKRRLFLSNILMLVLPVIISFVSISIVGMFVMRFFEDDMPAKLDIEQYYRAIERLDENVRKEGVEGILARADQLEEELSKEGIALAIYQNEEEIYASKSFRLTDYARDALEMDATTLRIQDSQAVYSKSVGAYRLLLTNAHQVLFDSMRPGHYRDALMFAGFFIVLMVLVIILLINRFLTRFVYKRIMQPIDALVYGVRQIRDGNLDYRIEYTGKDEFAPVCDDFNEMALRLSQMVDHRIKDEDNRKELIAGISHDLRTPLTSIKAYLEGLEQGVANTPALQQKYIDTIRSKTDDLAHIINQLFLFSKLDIGEYPLRFDRLDIGKYIKDLTDALTEEYAEKGLTIRLANTIEGTMADFDGVQLKNVFTNILENSLKYSDREDPIVKIGMAVAGDFVEITLADNGPGVELDKLDKLFDVFYRGDRARTKPGKGSGLGLAISKKMVERFGGSISAHNAPGGGLVLCLTLPFDTNSQKTSPLHENDDSGEHD